MKEKLVRFHLYRYQILPINRFFQADLYGAKSVEELIANKNNYFREALNYEGIFKTSKRTIRIQKLFERDEFILFRIAVSKSLNRETSDFKTEVIDNWPKIHMAVWNRPDKQLVAVQHRSAAFQNTDAFIRLMFNAIRHALSNKQLIALPEPLFEKHVFWDLISDNLGRIQEIEFEFITPNMANISGVLAEDLKLFAKTTNSIKNKLAIASDKSSSLNVDHDNPTINGLVDYSSEGGGDISIKLTGVKKKIHTSTTVKEFSIEESHLIGEPEIVAKMLKDLLK